MILIIGATGNVGRPLVAQLLARGATVRAISRHPATAGLPGGAEVVEADPSRPDSLDGCFDGVTAIFLNARAVKTAASEVLTLAERAGVAESSRLPPATSTKTTPGSPLAGAATSRPSSSRP
jgi:uncharacterized protein YbjT (DUF2867 family)